MKCIYCLLDSWKMDTVEGWPVCDAHKERALYVCRVAHRVIHRGKPKEKVSV